MADVPSSIQSYSTTAGNNSPSGSTVIGSGLDDNLRQLQANERTWYNFVNPSLNPGGRITLTSGTAVTTSDVIAATTVYYTPYKSTSIALYDGSTGWLDYTFSEISLAVPATTATMYDLWAYNNSGTVALEALAWSSDTARATALTTQNGILVKTGATTRRYLGSFRTTSASGQTEDSAAHRYVWNYYNRVKRTMLVVESTASWTYTTATYRQANGATGNQLDYVQGVSEDFIEAEVVACAASDQAINTVRASVGIGIDSTTVNSATLMTNGLIPAVNANMRLSAKYRGFPGIGRHTLVWIEKSTATGTTTWQGNASDATQVQSGIYGDLLG